MIAVDLEKVLLAVCQGCNEEFSEEPCEPGCCRIRAKIEKLPRVTLDDLRPKGRWEWLGPYRYKNDGMIGTCPVCKERLRLFAHNYCPNCGADMRGGGEDEY